MAFLSRSGESEGKHKNHPCFISHTHIRTNLPKWKGKRWKNGQREGLLKIKERIKQRAHKLAMLNTVSSPRFATPYRKELFGPAEMRDLTEQWQEYLLFVAHRSTY